MPNSNIFRKQLNPDLKWKTTNFCAENLSEAQLERLDDWSQYESFVDSWWDLISIFSSWEFSKDKSHYSLPDFTIERNAKRIGSNFDSLIARLEIMRKEAKENYEEIRQLKEESNAK